MGQKTGKMVVMLVLLLAIVITGCSKNNGAGSGASPSQGGASPEASASGKQEVTALQAIFPGDKPSGMDEVLAAVNEKLAKDGMGISLSINWVPWTDYGNTVLLKATSGESFDMFLDAPWLHIDKMITDGQILPLDEWVSNSPNLLSTIPQQMWEANKFRGKIYGIPMGLAQGYFKGFIVRKDLREKYGLPPIKTWDDFEAFLYTVKQNEQDIRPIAVNGGADASVLPPKFNKLKFAEATLGEGNYEFIQLAEHFLNYPDVDNPKVSGLWDEVGFTDYLHFVRKLYQDDIFEKNVLVEKDAVALFNAGQFASVFYTTDGNAGIRHLPLLSNVPGAELEIVMLYDTEQPKPLSTFQQANFLVVNKNAKTPEKVVQLAEWLSIKENHDLMAYGLPGRDWNPVGDDQYEIVEGSKYLFPGYVLTWRPALARFPSNMLPDDLKWTKMAMNADNFTRSMYTGLPIDTEPFKTELSKLQAAKDEFLFPLLLGVIDPEEGLKKLQDAYNNAGLGKVIEEVQKQVDAFLAK